MTLLDVWQALENMDRSMNERFDRLERLFDAMSARIEGFGTGIGAQLDALKAKIDEPRR